MSMMAILEVNNYCIMSFCLWCATTCRRK